MKQSKPKLPRFGDWLLRRLARYDVNPHLRGDFDEEFSFIYETQGFVRAWFWYWMHLLRSLPVFIKDILYWRFVMFKNYIKIALRNIKRYKAFSIINISGLALGMTAFILISLYVKYEFSFDKFHENSDKIYRVLCNREGRYIDAATPGPLAPTLKEEFPEVISSTRLSSRNNVLISHKNESFLEDNLFLTDQEFFRVFSFKLKHGNPETALSDLSSIVLSERMAKKYFGNDNAVGKTIRIGNSRDFLVSGVLESIPSNSHLMIDFLIPFRRVHEDWRTNNYFTYLLIDQHVIIKDFEKKGQLLVDKYIVPAYEGLQQNKVTLVFQPLNRIHLYSTARSEIANNNNSIKNIYILSCVGFFILLIACFNYINLAIAQAVKRSKEIGIRKVVGAAKKSLIQQHLSESLVIAILSFFTSIGMILLVLPVFNSFVDRKFHLGQTGNPQFILWLFALILFVGLLAGSYPAFYISSFKPETIIKGKSISKGKGGRLRAALVILQFAVSIFLIIGILVMKTQLDFIKNKDVGYKKDQIIVLTIRDPNVQNTIEALKTQIQRNPNVQAVTSSNHLPNRITNAVPMEFPNDPARKDVPLIYFNVVDFDFIDVFDIEIIKGRNFSPDFATDQNGVFIFNETALKMLGWEEPLGKDYHIIWWNSTGKTVGIMKDFHFHSLHTKIAPLLFYFNPNRNSNRFLSVRIRANAIPDTIAFLKRQMQQFSPGYPFEYAFFDDVFNSAYKSDHKLAAIFSIFSTISIFLGCLGLSGLVSYTTEQKTKEIGIRKVFGASVFNVTLNLLKEFAKWVLLANLIAWPVAYYAMNQWLQSFSYRIDMAIWMFLLASMVALLIALFSIFLKAVKAATANPVDSLRYE